MTPFKQTESAYTATAKSLQFTDDDDYDVDLLDNPVRRKVNAAIVQANHRSYKLGGAL